MGEGNSGYVHVLIPSFEDVIACQSDDCDTGAEAQAVKAAATSI